MRFIRNSSRTLGGLVRQFLEPRPFGVFALLIAADFGRAQDAPSIRLEVDASQAPKKVIYSTVIPVRRSADAFVSEMDPGEHAPTGRSPTPWASHHGKWTCDRLEARSARMYSVQVTVPAGVQEITVSQDFLSPTGTAGFSGAASATDNLFTLNWNHLLLYPRGNGGADFIYGLSRLPEGWEYGTALRTVAARATGHFRSVNLTTLNRLAGFDGPIFSGGELNDSNRAIPCTSPPIHGKRCVKPQ